MRRRKIVSAFSGAWLLAILGVWGVTRQVAEAAWWSTLLLYLPQVGYALPVVPLLLIAALQRHRKALGLNALSLLVVAGPMMGFNLPRPRFGPAPVASRVRVLAYNVLGSGGELNSVHSQVEKFRPDVVVFSEARAYRQDARFIKRLTGLLPGWHYIRAADVLVASRWPFVQTYHTPLSLGAGSDPSTEREIVHAIVDAPFGTFHVVGVHFRTALYPSTLRTERHRLNRYLAHTGAIRKEQADALARYLRGLRGPTLVCGDFNTPPAGRVYRRLKQGFRDAFGEAGVGWGYTYPSHFPLLRIDYVFCSSHWVPLFATVGPEPGSDHRPLFAELALLDDR